MGVSIEIRPASLEIINTIAPMLRQADRDEVIAATGLEVERAMYFALRLCDEPIYGTIDGIPAAVWGVNPISLASGHGSPWMLGTDLFERHAKHWLPLGRLLLNSMGKQYSYLENYVDARNKKSIRWLKWMGFQFDEAQPYGPFGLPFHRFWKVGV